MPVTKTGTASETAATSEAARSKPVPCRIAAIRPEGRPSSTAITAAAAISSSVRGSRSRMMAVIGAPS